MRDDLHADTFGSEDFASLTHHPNPHPAIKAPLFRASATAAALFAFGASAAAQSLTALGTGIAEGISADGTTVVGSSNGAWRWTAGTGQVSLNGLGAVGVSGDGSVVFGNDGSSPTTGSTWTSADGWTSIGFLPGSSGCPDLSNPYNISDGGDVATGLGWDDCSAFAFRWTPGGGFEQLPQMGPFSSRGNDVSGDGTHIGGWDEGTNGSRRAAVWFPGGTEQLILEGTPGNADGSGEVWGFSTDGSFACGSNSATGNAFIWSAANGAQDIGSIPGFPGATAMAISDDGKTAAGFAGIAFSGITAFIWTEAGGIQRFSDYASNVLGLSIPAGQDYQIIHDMTPDGTKLVGYVAADAGPFSTKTAVLIEQPAACGAATYGENLSPANYLDLASGGGTAVGEMFMPTTSGSVGGVTITALSLGAAEFPLLGGVAVVDPGLLINPLLAETPVAGSSTNTIQIPADPALANVTVYLQSFSDDAAQAEGFALSNGLALTICP